MVILFFSSCAVSAYDEMSLEGSYIDKNSKSALFINRDMSYELIVKSEESYNGIWFFKENKVVLVVDKDSIYAKPQVINDTILLKFFEVGESITQLNFKMEEKANQRLFELIE